jgi:hypothetical protein
MSPVSRGRKGKKAKQKRPTPPKRAPRYEQVTLPPLPSPVDLGSAWGGEPRGKWFDASTMNVLDKADVLLDAQSPRELEQATAELLGAELHRVVYGSYAGLWFNDWFIELVDAAAASSSEAHVRLLYGLTAIGSPALAKRAENAISPDHDQPVWLRHLPQVKATGEVWTMRDAYGSRIGFVLGCSYPEPAVFLLDIEAGRAPVVLVGADVFDDVEQAAAAWRENVGDSAQDAKPETVESSAEQLQPLAQLEFDEDSVFGNESRALMDNWFRITRRVHDLGQVLELPRHQSLYGDFDVEPMATAFSDWYERRNGAEPDSQSVRALAADWMEGVLPEFRYLVSPGRVEGQLTMFTEDWMPDDPLTGPAKALLPEWVRWHGEQSGLSERLIDRAADMATEGIDRMT